MCLQVLLGEKRGAVDALQLGIVLIALPKRACDGKQLESLDARCGGHVGAAAEVDEIWAERVFGKDLVRLFADQFILHPVAGVFFQAVGFFGQLALEGKVLGLQIPHAGFDLFEILRREGRLALEVIIESPVGWGADAEFGLREQFKHRGGQQMRG